MIQKLLWFLYYSYSTTHSLDIRLAPAAGTQHGRATGARSRRAFGPCRRRELLQAGRVEPMVTRERRRRIVELHEAYRALGGLCPGGLLVDLRRCSGPLQLQALRFGHSFSADNLVPVNLFTF